MKILQGHGGMVMVQSMNYSSLVQWLMIILLTTNTQGYWAVGIIYNNTSFESSLDQGLKKLSLNVSALFVAQLWCLKVVIRVLHKHLWQELDSGVDGLKFLSQLRSNVDEKRTKLCLYMFLSLILLLQMVVFGLIGIVEVKKC